MAVSVASGTSPGSYHVPLGPSFTYLGMRYPLAATGLTVDVPYASLQAAYDNRGDQRRQRHQGGQLRRQREQLLRAGTDRRRARPRRDVYRRCDDLAVA